MPIHRRIVLISISLFTAALSAGADDAELKPLPAKQAPLLQGTLEIEKSISPLQVNTLAPIQMEPLQLDANELESAFADSKRLGGLENSPLPTWLAIKQDESFPLYALIRFADGEAGIELLSFGKNSDLPESLTRAVLSKRPTHSSGGISPNQYSIDGALVVSILDALKINKAKNLYITALGSPSVTVIPLSSVQKLLVSVTEAGDTQVQVSIPVQAYRKQGKAEDSIIGIAFISTENPFEPETILAPIRWEDTQPAFSSLHLDEIAAHLVSEKEKLIALSASWKAASMKDSSLIEMKAPFKGEQLAHTLTGYFWKKGSDIQNLIPIYVVSDPAGYYNFPKPLLAGKILRGYGQIVLFGSNGMGDCGKFLVESLSGEVFQVPVRCKAVGC